MTIEKGKEWGYRGPCPQNLFFAKDDADLVKLWQHDPSAVFVMLSGDLHTSLGHPTWNQPDVSGELIEVQFLPVDIFRVVVKRNASTNDSITEMYALSSVEIGSWLTRGRYVCVSNCGFIGDYNIAPRAHPNDGEMDVVTVSKSIDWRQRLQARSRAKLGNHVPHLQIAMERGTSHSWTKASSRERLYVDGFEVKDWRAVDVHVLADACTVVV